jgi:DNA oxidative demethylase
VAAPQRTDLPESLLLGLLFRPDFLTPVEENELMAFLCALEFRTFQMQGVTAKRRIRQFGWHYAFESYQLTPTDPMPVEFASIRERSAALAGIDASACAEALVTEYAPGAGISVPLGDGGNPSPSGEARLV